MSGEIRCIWCHALDPEAPPEHVLPAGLGWRDEHTLTGGGTCRRCNHGLAYLDAVVVNEFDMARFVLGVKGRAGRPPSVASRGNAAARYERGKPLIYVNLSPEPVVDGDIRLGPAGRSAGDLRGSVTMTADGRAVMKVQHNVFEARNLVRALHKLALTAIAYLVSVDYARSARFDAVRRFVRSPGNPMTAIAKRRVLAGTSARPPGVWIYKRGTPPEAVLMQIVGALFVVDLSPDEEHLEALRQEAPSDFLQGEWIVLPYAKTKKRQR